MIKLTEWGTKSVVWIRKDQIAAIIEHSPTSNSINKAKIYLCSGNTFVIDGPVDEVRAAMKAIVG